MANPLRETCVQDVWTLVALNVTTGQIKKLSTKPNLYLETYRMTGDAAPTSRTEGVPMFLGSFSEAISAAAAIDVYVMAIGNDGEVRTDL